MSNAKSSTLRRGLKVDALNIGVGVIFFKKSKKNGQFYSGFEAGFCITVYCKVLVILITLYNCARFCVT